MAHNIDMSNNRANMAFIGSRSDIWHGLGHEMQPGMSLEDWAISAGLNWLAIKVPAVPLLDSPAFDHIDASKRALPAEGLSFVVRSDTGLPLGGTVSDIYQPVQPIEILYFFEKYISADSRFSLDTAGSLRGGSLVWAMAKFEDDSMTIVGEKHKARLLSTTTFDGTGSTINKATMIRVICNNTLDACIGSDQRAVIKTRHNTRFDPARAARELAAVAAGFEVYKQMAEAMVAADMAKSDISAFFKACLDIPFDAKEDDISTRKLNQFQALSNAYRETVLEGTKPESKWAALNAVTRYVDHERSTRGGDSEAEARVLSAQFGSGSTLKSKAVELLLPGFTFKTPELAAA